jgi:hypothetical protein
VLHSPASANVVHCTSLFAEMVQHFFVCVLCCAAILLSGATLECKQHPIPDLHSYKRISKYSISGFEDQFPLKHHMMREGLLGGDDIYKHINPTGFLKLFRKLSCAKPVTIAIFGGSFTSGHGLKPPDVPWPSVFIEWMRQTYPDSELNLINAAVPSSSTPLGYSLLRDKLSQNITMDLIMFDYSMNDFMLAGHEGSAVREDTVLLAVTEEVMRLALRNDIALLYMSVYIRQSVCDEVYSRVGREYGVPVLSYYQAVMRNVTYARTLPVHDPAYHVAGSTLSVFYPAAPKVTHPPFCVHLLLVDFIAYTILLLHHSARHARFEDRPIAQLAEPKFGGVENSDGEDNDDVSSRRLACFPATHALSSLNNDTKLGDLLHDPGWTFAIDAPGKPLGWLAGGKTRPIVPDDARYTQKLWLPGNFVQGRVTVTYLQSYENSGIFQMFLAGRVYLETGAFRETSAAKRKARPNLVPCCNITHVSKYATESVFIDTYSPAEKYSAVVETTVHFDAVGKLDLWILFVPLADSDFKERGGDKVKILGITTC